MPKSDPFRKLRIVALTPDGKNLTNKTVSVETMQNGVFKVSDSRGMVFEANPAMPIRILATAKNPQKTWPAQYTVTTGRIVQTNNSKLKIAIPHEIELKKDFEYSVLFPEETVTKRPSLPQLLRLKLKK